MPIVDAPTKLETLKLDDAHAATNGLANNDASNAAVDKRTDGASTAHETAPMRRRATDAAAQVPPPGADIPARYQLLNEIGVGGMGIVYKVYDRDTGEVIALKILKPEIAADEAMREGLRQEVCLARKVTHKNVCRIHEFNRSAAAACISMELVEGESLAAKLHREGALPAAQAIEIARQICAGLGEAHAQGIVHRDLKPSNIMVSSAGAVKIMDFGIARLSQGATQMTRTMVGTPEYMAPEQVELRGVSPRTDIYSLGLVLYEMVTGIRAFSGDSAIGVAVKQIREMPKRPAEIFPAMHPHLDAAIMQCLRKEPAKRFQTIEALDAALAEIQKPAPKAAPRAQKVQKLKAELQPAIERSLEAAKAAASHAGSLALQAGALVDKNARRASAQFHRTAAPAMAKSAAYLRANSKEWLTPPRIRTAQVASVVGVMFLTTAVTFGLVTGKGTRAKAAPVSVGAQHAAPAAAASPSLAPGAAWSPVGPQYLAPVSPDVAQVVRPEGVSSSFSSKKMKARMLAKAVAAGPSRPVVPARLPLAPSNVSSGAAPLTLQPAPDPTTLEPIKVEPSVAKHAAALTYLDVRSFKDTKAADTFADQLAKLGFHSLSVHKGALFLQSYHVEVGPYDNAADVDAAIARLAAQGYSARVVK